MADEKKKEWTGIVLRSLPAHRRKLMDYWARGDRNTYRIYICSDDDHFAVQVGKECFKAPTVAEVKRWIEVKVDERESLDWRRVIAVCSFDNLFSAPRDCFEAVNALGKTVYREATGYPPKPGKSLHRHDLDDAAILEYTEERWEAIRLMLKLMRLCEHMIAVVGKNKKDRVALIDAFMAGEININTDVLTASSESGDGIKKLVNRLYKQAAAEVDSWND